MTQLPLEPAVPKGGNSVMASRVATAPDELDYFPTPPWAARAGGELIKRLDPAAKSCWEPACGEGHLAHGLADYFATVHCSDIHDYGLRPSSVVDFLSPAADGFCSPDWIVSNPPFILGEAFVRAALARARVGVAMLLRLVFLEGAKRHALLYGGDYPLTVAAPFAERVPMVKGRWDPEASSATAYAWFVWDKHAAKLGGRDGVVPAPRLHPVPPGTRARLQKHEDLVRFGHAEPDPLFSAGGLG